MSEAGTGNTQRVRNHLRISIALAVLAAVLWVGAFVVIDRLPDSIMATFLAGAVVLSIAAINLGAGYARKRIAIDEMAIFRAEIREMLGDSTLDLTPLVIGMARIADRVRELTEATGDGASGTQIPTAVSAQIYDLGRRTGNNGDAN